MSQERITETRARASSIEVPDDLAEPRASSVEVSDDLTKPRASSINDNVGTKRQRKDKDESRPKNKKKKQGSVRDNDLEISAEIEEMFDSLTNNTTTPNPNPKVAIDRAKRKEDNDEIAKLFNWRQKKPVWEKDQAEIALQVEQVMANLELAVEDDVELNKQGKPATNKLIKLPILVDALSKKHLQTVFLDHGVLSLLKNWLEPLPDGSLPNTNIRTSVLQILEDLSIILSRGEECRREQLIKSGLAKVVMFLSKSEEETRVNKRLANDLVNRWGHMIYERSTRYETMLSREEREEQEKVLKRREKEKKKKAGHEVVKVEESELDVDLSVRSKPMVEAGRDVVPRAMAMDFVLRPRPKLDERLKARAKMHVNSGRYEDLMKRVKTKNRKESKQALKLCVDGHTKPKY